MKYTKEHLIEAVRMFRRHQRVQGKNFKKFSGNDIEIGEQILEELWNGTYYKTSIGHYPGFYSRDFGMVIDSLLKLGHKERVRKTLVYALNIYRKQGGIKTFISKKGKTVNFPNVYSPDSTAYMFRSVRVLNDKKIIKEFKPFLQEELNKYYIIVVHKITGEVKRKIHFGGMRDHSKRDSSAYDTVMTAMISREADKLGLENPLKRFDYKEILLENYWTGNYFKDNASSNELSADANIYPFWHDIIKDKQKLLRVIIGIKERHLDKPFPIKYVAQKEKKGETIFAETFVKDWEADAIWPMSALPYIDILRRVDKKLAKQHIDQYRRLILKYRTFLEVYDRNGKPFVTPFYSTDEGRIWVATYLVLRKDLLGNKFTRNVNTRKKPKKNL